MGTDADPTVVALGDAKPFDPNSSSYPSATSHTFEAILHEPILAPVAAKFIGWVNRNCAVRRDNSNSGGDDQIPYNDLEFCFEAVVNGSWPQAVFCVYHTYTSTSSATRCVQLKLRPHLLFFVRVNVGPSNYFLRLSCGTLSVHVAPCPHFPLLCFADANEGSHR